MTAHYPFGSHDGMRLTITHPDFVDDGARQRFLDGVAMSWNVIMEAQALAAPLWAHHDEDGVHVFVMYERGVRQAEMVVGSVIAATSIAAVEANRRASGQVPTAAYGFDVRRGVNRDEWTELLVESTEAGPT